MTKETKGKESSSGNFRVRKKDQKQIQRKGYWIDAALAHEFMLWCADHRTDESEVVNQLIETFMRDKKR